MKMPLFLVGDGDDIVMFWSEAEAQRYIEPQDARSGIYTLLDSEGHVITIEVHPASGHGFFGRLRRALLPSRVVLTEIPDAVAGEEGLASRLRQYLVHTTASADVSAKPLDDLVAMMVAANPDV